MKMRNLRKKSIAIALLVVLLLTSTNIIMTISADENSNQGQQQVQTIKGEQNGAAATKSVEETVPEAVYQQSEQSGTGNQTQQPAEVVQEVYGQPESSGEQAEIVISGDLKYITDRYIIKYKKDKPSEDVGKALKKAAAKSKKFKNNKNEEIEVITTNGKMKPDDFKNLIKGSKVSAESIEYIQPDYEMTISTNDPGFNKQWGVYNATSENLNDPFDEFSKVTNAVYRADINVIPAWEESTGEDIIVAVIDTGIDITHEDLSQNIFENSSEIARNGLDDDGNGYVDDTNGWNFVVNSNEVYNEQSDADEMHGTHIAGIIAAVKDNEKGIVGVAPGAKILALKVFQGGKAYTSDIIEAITYAETIGTKVVNCSWGSTEYNMALEEAIENSNMLFIAAAGNNSESIDENPMYPAAFDSENILSVASMNSEGELSGFSNYGVDSVDIVAPGEMIYSTIPENNYGYLDGTSMAAAFVAGEAALISKKYEDIEATEIKQLIANTTDVIDVFTGFVVSGGKINCYKALTQELGSNGETTDNTNDDIVTNPTNEGEYSLLAVNTWVAKKAMPTARYGLGVVKVNGKIYAIGGGYDTTDLNKVEEYDPITNAWTSKGDMPTARRHFAAVECNGRIYVFGGKNESILDTVEEYDPVSDTWTTKTSMPTSRYFLSAESANGKIYVIGGYDGSDLSIVEVYDPITDTWTTKANMPTARRGLSTSEVNGRIYAIGGTNGSYISTVEEYDPILDIWTSKTSMPSRRGHMSIAVVDGKIYAIGGTNGNIVSWVQAYNPITDTWGIKADIPNAVKYSGAASVNGKIYVIGGYSTAYTTTYVNFVQEYTAMMPLAAPTNITATPTSSDADSEKPYSRSYLSIDWAAVSTATGYDVEISGTVHENVQPGSFEATPGIQNELRVRSRYLDIVGEWSAYTNAIATPQSPPNIRMSSDYSRITVSWDVSNGATGYDIEIDGNIVDNGSNTIYVHTDVQPDQKHKYRIRARNSSGNGGWSQNYYYLTKGNVWQIGSNMHECREGLSLVSANNKLYAIGGDERYSNSDVLTRSSIEVFDQETNIWSIKANMLTNRIYHGAAASNGKIYAIGGSSSITITDENGSTHTEAQYLKNNEEYDPIADSWVAKAGMPTERQGMGIVEYGGYIYAIGGYNGNYLGTVEKYDPLTDAWTLVTSMPTARSNMSVVVHEGKIYVIGGFDGSFLNLVEEYDPITDTWVTKAPMPTARKESGAAVHNGKVYVIGGEGSGGYLGTVEEYDPATDTWTSRINMPTERTGLGVTSLNGKIYAIGGRNDIVLNITEVYTPSPDSGNNELVIDVKSTSNSIVVSWNPIEGVSYDIEVDGQTVYNYMNTTYIHKNLMPNERHSYRVRTKTAGKDGEWSELRYYMTLGSNWKVQQDALVARKDFGISKVNGKVYIIGGKNEGALNNVEEYDTVSGKWTEKSSMPAPKYNIDTVSVKNKIYVIGGCVDNSNGSIYLSNVEEYDTVTDTWVTKASMPNLRMAYGAAAVNGKIYIAGGYDGTQYLNTLEVYDPATDTWETKAPMNTPRAFLKLVEANGKLYAIGGTNENILSIVEEYDSTTDTWTTKSNMPNVRYGFGTAILNGSIYVVGGSNSSLLESIDIYNPITDTWAQNGSILTPRHGLGVVEINGSILAVGGNSSYITKTVELFSTYLDDTIIRLLGEIEELNALVEDLKDQTSGPTPTGRTIDYIYDANGNLKSIMIK